MKMQIAPSVLACNPLAVGDEIKRAVSAGADMLHLDIMDGVYVPNMSFGFDFIKSVKTVSSVPLDVHMMTVCPQKFIDVLKKAGADNVTVHHDIASKDEVIKMLCDIKNAGMKASVALRPKFDASDVVPFLPYIDMALVMTVEPGFGGQSFMKDMLPKIGEIRKMSREISIQVDGGINANTAALCAKAGADVFVVGTASFGAPDMKSAIDGVRLAATENGVM